MAPGGPINYDDDDNIDDNVSVLGQDEGFTVKYNPLPERVPKGEARGNF